mgnify:FL=1
MKKIWIPAALMALAACSMTNNAEKGQGDSQDITARPAITQVAENVPSEPSVDSVEVDGISSATALPNHSSFNGIMVVPPQRQATVTLTMGGTVHATTLLPGDYVKKPMRACTGKEITEEWLYHLGIPEDQIEELAENHANCTPTMMPYITAFFMPRRAGDRPDVIPDGCVNAAFLGQFAETPRDTIFTTEYSVRTAMEAVYGLCGVDRGVPEVWGSVYDIRELLDSTVKLMDGRSPLEMKLPMPLEALKKPILRKIDKTVVGKLLRDHGVLKDWMV